MQDEKIAEYCKQISGGCGGIFIYFIEALIATLNAQLKKKLTLYGQDKLQFEINTLNQLRDKFNELSEK